MNRPWRILVVDSEYRYSVGGSFCRGFRALGHDAHFFDQSPWVGGWVNRGRVSRLLRLAARPLSNPALNLALLTTVFAQKPDIVLVLKGWHVFPETITAMRRVARFVVSYHPDDFENPLNTHEGMLRSIPLWDALFTPRVFAVEELRARGARHVEPLAFGYDPLISHPAPHTTPPEPGLEEAVVFVGSGAPERKALFEPLATELPFRIWGNQWGAVPKSSPLFPALRHRALLDDPLRATLTQSAISVALLRKGNRDRHTMRTFEIPACAGFMLAERSDEHCEYFEEGKEAVFFDSPDELREQSLRYLKDNTARRRIAEAGFKRVTTSGHRYQDRAARMLEVLHQLG